MWWDNDRRLVALCHAATENTSCVRVTVSQVKVNFTTGSNKPGWIGTVRRLADASVLWKAEGPSDVMAMLSCEGSLPDVALVTNSFGAGDRPTPWMLQQLADNSHALRQNAVAPH
jgi:hypothetical protein